jgi:hypothetical protein
VARPFRAGIDPVPLTFGAPRNWPRTPNETLWRPGEAIFPGARSRHETKIGYQKPLIQQRSSIMWDIIISLFYHQACKRYVAAARRQRTLWA